MSSSISSWGTTHLPNLDRLRGSGLWHSAQGQVKDQCCNPSHPVVEPVPWIKQASGCFLGLCLHQTALSSNRTPSSTVSTPGTLICRENAHSILGDNCTVLRQAFPLALICHSLLASFFLPSPILWTIPWVLKPFPSTVLVYICRGAIDPITCFPLFLTYLFVYGGGCCDIVFGGWSTEDNFQESFLSSYHVGTKNRLGSLGLAVSPFYQPSFPFFYSLTKTPATI